MPPKYTAEQKREAIELGITGLQRMYLTELHPDWKDGYLVYVMITASSELQRRIFEAGKILESLKEEVKDE